MNVRSFSSIFVGGLVMAATACGSSESSGEAGSGSGSASTGGLGNSDTGVVTGGPPTSTGVVIPTTNSGEVGTGGTSEASGVSSSTGCSGECETEGPGPGGCDNFAQDCPEGQKCAAWVDGVGGSWNATRCVPVVGDQQPGELCTAPEGGFSGLDDCAKGGMCWEVGEGNMGVCIALCTGTSEAPVCADDEMCSISAGGFLILCIPECDPLTQDCPDGKVCIPNGVRFVCVLDASGEEGQANDGCEFANGCDKGLACVDTAEASSACDPQIAGCCQPLCAFPGGGCPNPDQACVQWYDPMELPPDSPKLKYGICKISG